jgi:hypothetical protein
MIGGCLRILEFWASCPIPFQNTSSTTGFFEERIYPVWRQESTPIICAGQCHPRAALGVNSHTSTATTGSMTELSVYSSANDVLKWVFIKIWAVFLSISWHDANSCTYYMSYFNWRRGGWNIWSHCDQDAGRSHKNKMVGLLLLTKSSSKLFSPGSENICGKYWKFIFLDAVVEHILGIVLKAGFHYVSDRVFSIFRCFFLSLEVNSNFNLKIDNYDVS